MAAREPRFLGTISYTKLPVAGLALYRGGKKPEPTIEEMLDELERSDIQSTKKELLLGKLRDRGAIVTKQGVAPAQPNPKRYLVNPETGKIDIDEKEGEYTYKDALMVSSSVKGKSGQYDDAISLINLVKTLSQPDESKSGEKPTEFYVDPETGVIIRDTDNGELTLSEARAVSQSIKKKASPDNTLPGAYIDEEGNVQQLKPGQPIVITKKVVQEPNKVFLLNAAGELEEHESGKPIVVKVQSSPGANTPFTPFPAMARDGAPITDKDGRQVYVDIEPQMKWLGFQSEQKRADEVHNALMGLAQTIRENIPDGIAALKAAAAEAKSGTGKKAAPTQKQTFACGDCQMQFSPPPEWTGEQSIKCPNPACGREYTKEELLEI